MSDASTTADPSPLPAELVERLRRPAPQGCSVVPGSLPVVGFGPTSSARVLTLSTNPSKLELTTPRGVWLEPQHRRVDSLRSHGVESPDELTDAQLAETVRRSADYFAINPHTPAFAPAGELLTALGASYADGTAAHLDLVQWATNPVWSGLPPAEREQLVDADAEFLRWQLARSAAAVVLVDGAHVAQWLPRAGVVDELEVHEVPYLNSRGNERTLHLGQAQVGGKLLLALDLSAADTLSPDGRARRLEWMALRACA